MPLARRCHFHFCWREQALPGLWSGKGFWIKANVPVPSFFSDAGLGLEY